MAKKAAERPVQKAGTLNKDWRKVIPKKYQAEYERRVNAGEAVSHFVPDKSQVHFADGKVGVPLCRAAHPTYVGDTRSASTCWVLSTGTNVRESVTCRACARLYDVRDKLCRGCGTMITDTTRSQYAGLCPKCRERGDRIGIIDIDREGNITGLTGAAAKNRARSEKEVADYIEEKKRAVEAKKALAEAKNRSYDLGRSDNHNPTSAASDDKEDTMGKGKGSPDALKKAREAKAEKAGSTIGGFDKGLKIKILIKENPHREGTGRAESFEKVLKAKTVGDYDGKAKYLKDWVASEHIKIG